MPFPSGGRTPPPPRRISSRSVDAPLTAVPSSTSRRRGTDLRHSAPTVQAPLLSTTEPGQGPSHTQSAMGQGRLCIDPLSLASTGLIRRGLCPTRLQPTPGSRRTLGHGSFFRQAPDPTVHTCPCGGIKRTGGPDQAPSDGVSLSQQELGIALKLVQDFAGYR